MTRQDRQIAGWRELYNSIQANIRDASGELTSLFEQKESAQKELPRLYAEIEKANKELSSILQAQAVEKDKTKSFWLDLEAEEKRLITEKSNLENFAVESQARIEEREKQSLARLNSQALQYSRESFRIGELQEHIESLKREVGGQEQELSSLRIAENSLRDLIREAQAELDELRRQSESINKEILKQRKYLEDLKGFIENKRKSLLTWKGDMDSREKKISIREKDLTILEGRVRRRLSGLIKQGRKFEK